MLSHSKKIGTQLFKDVLDKGKTYHFTFFSIKVLKLSTNNKSRFTIIVPKKVVKKAISRNLIRRRFFNIIKEVYKDFPTSLAIIFFFKKGSEELKFEEIKKEIIKVLNKV